MSTDFNDCVETISQLVAANFGIFTMLPGYIPPKLLQNLSIYMLNYIKHKYNINQIKLKWHKLPWQKTAKS